MTYLARLVGRARGDADGGLRPRHRSRYETPPARDSEPFTQTVRPALDRAPEARSTGRSEGEPSLAVTEPATVHVADPAPAPTRPAAAPSARPIGPERFWRVEAVAEPAEAEPPATRAPAVTFAPCDDAGRARLARPAVAAAAPTGPVPEGIRDRTAPAEVAGDVAPTAAEPAGWPPLGRRQIAPSGQVIPALAVFDDDGHAPVVSERPPRPAFLHAGRRGDDRARPEPSRHAPGPPVIEVTIGRVEVRAVPESRKAEPAGRAAPPLALADYLAEQRRGRVEWGDGMSNHLAVATVTAAMRRLLEVPLTADVPGALVKVGRPDAIATAAAPTVNMYLYQVLPNGARRNDDLPSRRADGSLVERPRAAIDLSYLISFFGDDQELEPQRLLGSTVRTFTSRPLLGSELFDEVVVAAGATPPVYPALIESDLADAPEPVRLAPLPLDLDSLSKLWSVFFQTPHVLSIAWSASVVFLEESLVTTPSLPVVAPAIEVTPLRRPAIIAVAVRDAPAAPVTTDAVIRLTGRQLAGDVTTVRVAGVDLEPESATAQTVDVDLATALAGTLRAGPAVIEVVHRRLRGVPPTPRDIVTSPPFPVVLHPRITAASVAGGSLRLDCEPVVGARQVAVVELRGPGSPVAVRVLAVPEHDDVTTVAVPVAGVDAGSYDTVVVVDGAASTPRSVTVP